MTVQFRGGWQGNAAGSIATLDAATEAAVIAAGFARDYREAAADPQRGGFSHLQPAVRRKKRTVYHRRTASGLVAKAPAHYIGYSCSVADGTISIYDSLGPSGTVVVPTTTLAVGEFPWSAWLGRQLLIGCYVVLSGDAAVVNINVDAYW